MDLTQALAIGGTGITAAMILQSLKHARVFGMSIDDESSRINALWAAVLAFFAAIGVHFTLTYNASTGAGDIAFTGFTLAAIWHGLLHWAAQYLAQHVAYKQFVVPTELQAKNLEANRLNAKRLGDLLDLFSFVKRRMDGGTSTAPTTPVDTPDPAFDFYGSPEASMYKNAGEAPK